jgi:hypothetical protein
LSAAYELTTKSEELIAKSKKLRDKNKGLRTGGLWPVAKGLELIECLGVGIKFLLYKVSESKDFFR